MTGACHRPLRLPTIPRPPAGADGTSSGIAETKRPKKRVYKLPRGAPDDGAVQVTVSISKKKILDISFREKLKKPILQTRYRLVK